MEWILSGRVQLSICSPRCQTVAARIPLVIGLGSPGFPDHLATMLDEITWPIGGVICMETSDLASKSHTCRMRDAVHLQQFTGYRNSLRS